MADPVALDDVNTAIEDGAIVTGNVGSNDTDADMDIVTFALVGAPPAGLTFNPDGSYLFNPLNPAYQHLAQGATFNVVATYTVTDALGGTDTATLTITVTGTNDAPVAADDTATATEDGALATGDVGDDDTDVDDGATRTFALASPVDGLTLGSNGLYSFNPGHASYQHIAQGATQTVVATYVVTDQHGATDTATLTITVTGTNDAPVAVADNNSATEGGATVTGNVGANDTDVDDGAVLTYSHGVLPAGLTFNPNGNYSFDPTNAAYDSLALGQSQAVGVNYVVTDQHGASSASTLTIVVQGANDAPVAVADTNSGDPVTESGVSPGNTAFPGDSSASGNVLTNDTDVDTGDTKEVSEVNGLALNVGAPVAGTYGSVVINGDGTYTYTLDNNDAQTNALAHGASATDVFSYTVEDANGATSTTTLTITITGTNDAPVANADSDTAVEAGVGPGNDPFPGDPTATGNVLANDTDVDTGDSKTVTAVAGGSVGSPLAGTYGSVTINGDGSYTYTLDNGDADTNALDQGDAVTDQFTYTMTDANGATSTATLTINITGANDAPIANDDDNTGDPVIEAGVNPGNTPEAGDASAAGNVLTNDTDVDADDTRTVSAVTGGTVGNAVTGTYGSVTINADGSWSYSLDNNDAQTNALAHGASATDVFTYTVLDSDGATDTATLTINLTGTNDAPVANADTDTASESGVNPGNTPFPGDPSATGNVLANDTDVDTGDSKTVSAVTGGSVGSPVTGTYGSVTINSDGSYTYTLDNGDADTNALAQGASVTDQFTYVMTDANGASSSSTLTITITGTNDAPVAVADTNTGDPVTEFGVNPGNTAFPGDSSASGNVLTNDTDVDTGDIKTVLAVNGSNGNVGNVVGGEYGSVTINSDGTYTYTLTNGDTETNALAQGETVTDVFTYTVYDFNFATSTTTLTITITGTNDAPVAVADTDTVSEAGVNPGNTPFPGDPTATGNVLTNDTDVDTGDGQEVTEVNGSGANVGMSVGGTYGSVTIGSDGSYTYTLDNGDADTNALAQGVSVTDVFTYMMVDDNGASSTSTLTVTITGTNDAPVAVADTNTGDPVTEAGVNPGNTPEAGDDTATGNVLANDTDVDTGDTKAVSEVNGSDANVGVAVAGTYGSVTIDSDGDYTYTLDNNDAETNALAHGETVTDVFTYTLEDANGATSTTTLTITITGTNDAPVAVADTDTVSEAGVNPGNTPFPGDPTATGNVLTNDTDVDTGDGQEVTEVNGSGANVGMSVGGTYGSVTIGSDGSYTYTLDNGDADTNALAQGVSVTDVFTYMMVDDNGASSTSTLTVTITGTNDAPVAVADTNPGDPVTESGVNPGNTPEAGDDTATGNVLANDTDVDTGDTKAVSEVNGSDANVGVAVAGTYGSVTIDSDGDYTYTLDNNDAETNALAHGETVTDVFNYTLEDANGATSTTTLTITITGTNDAPVAVADTDTASEAGVNPGNTPFPGDPTATGNVLTNDTDVDTGDSQEVTEVNGSGANVGMSVGGTYGSVTIGSDGSYTYMLDNGDADTNALAQGVSVTDVFTYMMVDDNGASSTSTLTVTITGTNDAPVAVADTNTGDPVTEAGVNPGNTAFPGDSSASGNVLANDTDVDAGDTRTVTAVAGGSVGSPVTGTYGSVTIGSDGSYTYALNNGDTDTNALAQGATASDVFSYTITDANGATSTTTLTIAITGTNDAPDANNDSNTAVEDGPIVTGSVAGNDTDVDTGATRTWTLNAPAAGLTLNPNGSYIFNTLDPAYQSLAQGVTQNVVATYTVTDQHGATDTATLTITVTGTNDAPIANDDTAIATEDGATVTGDVSLDDTDVDIGDTHTYALVGTVPGLTINPDGTYSFDPASYDSIAQGATQHVTATYRMTDNHGASDTADLVITVTGINDAPVAVADSDTASESGVNPGNTPFPGDPTATGNVLTNDIDVDDGATRTVSAVTGGSVGSPVAGTYGSVTIASDGSYTYTLDNGDTDTNALAQGASATDQFTYTVMDQHGATSSTTLTINITGTNDAPIANDDTASATEDGAVVNGTVATNDSDVDTGDTRTYTLNGTVDGLTLNPDGSYSFDPSDPAYQHIAVGATQIVTATYTLTDTNGATDTADLVITVTGVNDAPVGVADSDTAIESGVNPGNTPFPGDPTATGNVLTNDTDVDDGATRTVSAVTGGSVGSPVAGTYGSVTIASDGSYTYTLDNGDADTNALAQGASATDQFTYTVMDQHGATSSTTLTINITGTNDAPIANDDTASATEDGAVVNGTVATNDSDVDTGDTRTYTLNGTVDGLTLNPDGSYSFDPSDPAYQHIAVGATQIVTATYTLTDTNGATDTADLVITVTGVNDAPVGVADSDTAIESGVNPGNTPFPGDPTATGNVLTNDTDVDDGATRTVSAVTGGSVGSPVAGTYGSVTIASDGSYTYTLDNGDTDTNALAQGASATDQFTYTVMDQHGATSSTTLTINITGTNDAPDAVNDSPAVSEDGPVVNGSVATNDSDPDTGAVLTYTLDDPAPIGFSFNADGSYSFDRSSVTYQALAQGQTQTITLDYTVTDQHGATDNAVLTITVNGVNDAPVGNDDTASATEDGAVVFGNVGVNDTDVDNGATRTWALNGTVPGLTINSDGSYVFNPLHPAYQSLAQGATQNVVATYTVTDEHGATDTATLTITVTGVNDAPVANDDSNTAVEDGATVTGNVGANDSDVDAGATRTYALNAPVDGLTFNPNGSYSFDPTHASYQSLALGTTQNVVATYTTTDDQGATDTAMLTITVIGTNDAPVANDDTNSATEDGAAVTGNVGANDTDVDAGATRTYALSAPVAGLTLNPDGSYSFDPSNAAYQALAQGATQNVVATYTATDQHGATDTATLTVTVTGVNDAPVANDDTASATEGGATVTGNVGANDTDVDAGASLSYAPAGPLPAGFTFGPNGSYSFDPTDPTYDSLALGVTQNVVFNYTVSDGLGGSDTGTLTITVTGTNDAPVANDDTASATEDGAVVTGNVGTNDTDVDTGATRTYSLNAPVAGLTLNPDGSYSFDPSNAAYQALAQGATQNVVATYTATDQHGATDTATLTVTVTGVNDAPVANDDTASATEDGAVVTGNVGANDTDVDNGATRTYALGAPVAGLTLNPDGSYSFDPSNAAYQSLAAGVTQNVVATYTATDQHGASDTATLTITVTGVNDAAVITGDTSGSTTETDAVLTVTGNLDVTDVDGDDVFVTQTNTDGTYGAFSIDADGDWSYVTDNAQNQFAAGQTYVDTFTVASADGTTQSVTITITGSNDAPVANDDTDAATEDGALVTGNVGANDTDVDTGSTHTYALNAPVAGLSISSNGSYIFNTLHPAYQSLAQGATQNVVASYTITDDQGATDTATLTITVTGTNDAPVANNDTNGAIEDTVLNGDVGSNDSDVDAGAILTYTLDAPVTGLTLNPNGSYSFNAGNAAYQHLAVGATQTVVANYTVTDEHGATDTATLTITVTGTNDAPVANNDTITATEDGAIVTGNVGVNDTDVDDGATRTYALIVPVAGLTLSSNGNYSFNPANFAYQSLAEGDSQIFVVGYRATDQHGAIDTATITITVTGTNDAPIALADTNSATEDGAVVTGNVGNNDSDVDSGATRTYALDAPVDGLSLNSDGSYSFDPTHASYQSVAAGTTQNVVATYTVTDDQGATDTATLTITIAGVNDAPLADDDTASATEDGAVVTGDVSTNDTEVDTGTTLTYTLDAPVAGLTLNPDGTYSFDPSDAAYQSLAQGAIENVVATYIVNDGQGATDTATLTITVFGANDGPVAVDDTASATEGGALVSGNVGANDSDVDDGAALSYAPAGPLPAGFTFGPNGNYSFDPTDPAYDSLALGVTQNLVFTYTVSDEFGASDTATLTITVTGTNDAPVANDDTNSATEDGAAVTGNVGANDTDVDTGATRTYSLNAPVAGLTLNPDGSYSFDPSNAAYQALAQGATQNVVATYTATDQHGATDTATLTVTVTGVNDAPVANDDTASATEDGAVVTGNVGANDTDVDNGATRTYALGAPVAGLTLNPDGSYSFDPSNAAYQSLAAGVTQNVVATYTATDQHGASDTATLTITVTGVNDAAVITGDTSGSTTETDAVLTVTGNLDVTDVDGDDVFVTQTNTDGTYGAFSIDADGDWSYVTDNAQNQFAAGQTYVDTFTVASADGTTQSVTITITGSNDAPVANDDTDAATEDGAVVVGSVATNDTDVDTGATRTFALDAPVAGLTLSSNGGYIFNPLHPAYQSLAAGATQNVVASYTVTDEHGATDTATLTITVTGTNDAPVANDDANTAVEGGAAATGNVGANDSDVDAGATRTYALSAPVDGLTLNPDGSYSFDPTHAAYQALALGATQTVVATYIATDDQGATDSAALTITVIGTNDAPVANDDTNSATEDGAAVTGNVGTNDTDVDTGATRTYALNAPVAGLTLNPDGSYSFDPSNAAYQALAQGATQNVVATYTATDEHGATDTATLTVTVTGVNDAPVANDDTASATEDGAVVTGNVGANDTDVDNGATRTYALGAPVAGLTLNPDGSYSFDPSNAAYQSLAAGVTQNVVATYTATDQHGASDTATLTITVTGVNDAGVAQPDAFATNEATDVNGNVFANNGSGADEDVDGPLTVAAVNGSASAVGNQITLASGALLTLNADGTFAYDLNGAFDATPAAGSGASNLSQTDSFTYTLAGGGTTTVTLTISGLDSNDTLLGTAGTDALAGGAGDDRYFIENATDTVIEALNAGFDRVLTSVSWTLNAGSHVEMITTQDNDATTAINLTGNALFQYIYGNEGANEIDGGGGGDVMYGFGGDDRFYTRNVADRVVEFAAGGFDRVLAEASFTLEAGSEVEMFTTTDNLATTAINLTGNELSQYIYGNAGANEIDSGGGGDVMYGFEGDDRFYTRNAADRVVESAGGGNDRVLAGASFTLEAGSEVEMFTTIDNLATTAINLTGNELAQYIYGNAGANTLDGKGGADVLTGFGGADNFTFTSALGGGNIDRIADFNAAADTIQLDDAVFTGLALGALNPNAFVIRSDAGDADDRIIYNQATGQLFFDADGNGAGVAVHFATLDGAPLITASDFTVI